MDKTTEPTPQFIRRIAERVQSVHGVAAIVLGGSRAQGNHTPQSDVDIGIYYRPENPLDVTALNLLAAELDDRRRENLLTEIGAWGKWINGGGWLRVEGVAVDFLYRDVDQVRRVVDECRAGRVTIDYQPGHPHGFASSIYLGEVAVCAPLYDPDNLLADLKSQTRPYPAQLKAATMNKFAWEISFSLFVAKKATTRGDVGYAAGCCFRSVACMNQTLFALNEAYLLNEKGATAVADAFALCPRRYRERIDSAFALLETEPASILRAIAVLEEIERELSQWYGNRQLNQ
jgi:predicted nucleotidyltransferase